MSDLKSLAKRADALKKSHKETDKKLADLKKKAVDQQKELANLMKRALALKNKKDLKKKKHTKK